VGTRVSPPWCYSRHTRNASLNVGMTWPSAAAKSQYQRDWRPQRVDFRPLGGARLCFLGPAPSVFFSSLALLSAFRVWVGPLFPPPSLETSIVLPGSTQGAFCHSLPTGLPLAAVSSRRLVHDLEYPRMFVGAWQGRSIPSPSSLGFSYAGPHVKRKRQGVGARNSL